MSTNAQSPFQRPFNQICYYVDDMRKAAQAWHDLTGAGPFYVLPHIQFKKLTWRGEQSTVDQSSVIGNWGPIQLELYEQHDDSPASAAQILPGYDNPELGVLHHVNFVADDLDAEIKRIEALGYPADWRATVQAPGYDMEIAMFDTRRLTGSLTEVYQRHEGVELAYKLVRDSSIGWDGSRLLRELSDLGLDDIQPE